MVSMQKILIEIKENTLEFSGLIKLKPNATNLLNTNIISNNELLFSEDYLKDNTSIVSLFIKEMCSDKKISKVIIDNMNLVPIISKILINSNINSVNILEEVNITYEAYESLISIPSLKEVICFTIPTYMLDLFDKKEIQVESRQEVLFTSKFMEDNKLTSYSKIYYKSTINFNTLTPEDIEDFKNFLRINKYLKIIYFNTSSIEPVNNIVDIIVNFRLKKIKIIIIDDSINKEKADNLRRINKKYPNNVIIRLSYSKEYIKRNYLKQIILTTLSYCLVIIITIVTMTVSYIFMGNYQSEQNMIAIKEEIEEQLKDYDIDNNPSEEPSIPTTPDEGDDGLPSIPNLTPNEAYLSLREINNDTVGWLTVPGTNIDYPVVKTTDNDYYLTHNYKKQNDYNGWVFMHYLNNDTILDKNTILFAHNRYYSGVMFGTLNKINNKDWYNNASNNLITFNTIYNNYKWEVFSIYSINVTADYLKTIFNNDKEWSDFIKLISDRSVFKSNIEVGKDDKILTLSTCLDNNRRLVVHAVLKKS